MSFVPVPQQANAANANTNQNVSSSLVTSSLTAATAEGNERDELLFKIRTFDVYWVEKHALMYRDGIAKVSKREHDCAV